MAQLVRRGQEVWNQTRKPEEHIANPSTRTALRAEHEHELFTLHTAPSIAPLVLPLTDPTPKSKFRGSAHVSPK